MAKKNLTNEEVLARWDAKDEHPGWTNMDLIWVMQVVGSRNLPPKVGDHKAKIIGWMMLWPASMVWTMLNDPIRRVFEEIYDQIGSGLQAMSDRIFRDVTITKDRT